MKIVTLKIWRRDGQIYAAMAMNVNGGALSWSNVDQVEIDRITIEADNWGGEYGAKKAAPKKREAPRVS